MRTVSAALFAILIPWLACAQPATRVGAPFAATVIHVADGDTIDVRVASTGERVRIRVHGIDAPERGEPFSQVALRFTRATVFDRTVSVERRDVDVYGRVVARVRVDGADLSEALLRAGLACHYRRYSDDPVLEQAEADARAAARGFWAPGASQPRCVAREAAGRSTGGSGATSSAVPSPSRTDASRQATTHRGRVVGNTRSRVYHDPSCRNANCPNCTRSFATSAEADAAGYRPAGDCLDRRR